MDGKVSINLVVRALSKLFLIFHTVLCFLRLAQNKHCEALLFSFCSFFQINKTRYFQWIVDIQRSLEDHSHIMNSLLVVTSQNRVED